MESAARLPTVKPEAARLPTCGAHSFWEPEAGANSSEDSAATENSAAAVRTHLRIVRQAIAELKPLFLDTPSESAAAIAAFVPVFEQAIRLLQQATETFVSGGSTIAAGSPGAKYSDLLLRSQLAGELSGLRAELSRVEHLRRNGLEFWNGWSRLLGLDQTSEAVYSPHYTSAGVAFRAPHAAPQSAEERVLLEA